VYPLVQWDGLAEDVAEDLAQFEPDTAQNAGPYPGRAQLPTRSTNTRSGRLSHSLAE
jgi:hypothetical protein